ncbi:GbsR/MarR family transcriptional regulator [Pseudalkalibacillus salsuginis]|uniref:GbsR/MarR family transcriptional regulator n=1 Tax=Pseudalkalibacillus salsuginis TaxID=2910972 RepID=UPI001CD620FC|nr:GbsR/MarR family transcriptional regulator [Pseudalkalibacillus salsuginis]MCF6409769.1 GbsR/MarR family transcriptional regulator [Pseudalkalibacillus salsuginis]
MNEKFKEIRERIIEQNSESQTLYSMHHTLKRLMSIMYYYEKPMTLDDMASLLGMSKASMSNAVRELIEIGLVKKVWKKGERKDIYQVEEDNYESFIKFFCYHWRKQITPKTSSMRKSIRELKELAEEDNLDEETKALIEKDLEKLYDGLDYLSWVSGVIELFETHEIFDYVPKKSRDKMSNR